MNAELRAGLIEAAARARYECITAGLASGAWADARDDLKAYFCAGAEPVVDAVLLGLAAHITTRFDRGTIELSRPEASGQVAARYWHNAALEELLSDIEGNETNG